MQKYIILCKSIIALQTYNIQYAKYAHIIYTQYTKVQSVYIIRQAKIDKRTKPFFFMSGTGYVFAYRSLIMNWVSRGGGRRWCKQLSGWEILLKNFLSALSAKF